MDPFVSEQEVYSLLDVPQVVAIEFHYVPQVSVQHSMSFQYTELDLHIPECTHNAFDSNTTLI